MDWISRFAGEPSLPAKYSSIKQTIALTIRMRTLIYQEFGVLLSLQEEGIEQQFCAYGFQSKQAQLRELAGKLAALMSIPLPEPDTAGSNLLTLLCSKRSTYPVKKCKLSV